MFLPTDYLCTSFTSQMLVWLNVKQPELAFDLLFCLVQGIVEGSLFAAHWTRWIPYGIVKPISSRLSGSQLRFMNTERTQSFHQLV